MQAKLPSPSMLVASIALAVALAGSAWAAVNLPKNSVGSKQLKKGAVKTKNLSRKAVGSKNLKPGAVGAKSLQAGSVGASNLQAGSVGASNLQAGSVGTSNLQDGSVGASNLNDGSVTGPKLDQGLLETLQSALVRFAGPRSFSPAIDTGGTCGAASSSTYGAKDFDRLIFYSYAADRDSGAGSADYVINRPNGNEEFTITGSGSKAGEGFFYLPAGDSANVGAAITGSDCIGTPATVAVDYLPVEIEEKPKPPSPE
jgi:hypothetical protein